MIRNARLTLDLLQLLCELHTVMKDLNLLALLVVAVYTCISLDCF